MKEKIINNLLSARFLVTIILTIVFAVLSIIGGLTTEFITIYTMIVTFYFSRERNDKNDNI